MEKVKFTEWMNVLVIHVEWLPATVQSCRCWDIQCQVSSLAETHTLHKRACLCDYSHRWVGLLLRRHDHTGHTKDSFAPLSRRGFTSSVYLSDPEVIHSPIDIEIFKCVLRLFFECLQCLHWGCFPCLSSPYDSSFGRQVSSKWIRWQDYLSWCFITMALTTYHVHQLQYSHIRHMKSPQDLQDIK